MTYPEIFLLALALSVDACIVSFTYGLTFNQNRLKNSLMLATFTGTFQGIMPILGYFITTFVKSYIQPFADWIIFGIFLYLGTKVIIEACQTEKHKPHCIDLTCLLLIGIATSIDAFSAGITFSLYGNKIFKPALLITAITFINSLLGYILGGNLRNFPTKSLEIAAGTILIGLGIKSIL